MAVRYKRVVGRGPILALLFIVSVVIGGPAFAEVDQYGTDHDWRSSPGRYTVLDFAASWCAPCRKTLPKLEAFAKDHPELRILVVSVDDEVLGRDRLVESLSLTLPVVWDENYAIAERFKPPSLPATVVLDPQGKVAYEAAGSSNEDWRDFVTFMESLPALGPTSPSP